MLEICEEMMKRMIDHAVKNYPSEACGLLVGAKGQNSVTDFEPCKNIYDKMHERDPQTYPRTSKTAYLIDSGELKKIFDEAEKNRMEVKAVVHSHTDHDAYFSEEDRLMAAPWGEPMYPKISYIVISIRNGKFKEANEYYWDDKKREFVLREGQS
ncbi:MAG: M67 family metallopeptidase [Deltaproteobacteria bacterium]|nr:M67 family metallopeptidase [Deltaproteobacteria bacterium]